MGDILEMYIQISKRAASEIYNTQLEIQESIKSFKSLRDEIHEKILQAEKDSNTPIFPNTSCNKTKRTSKRWNESSSSDDEANVSSTRVKLHNLENVENSNAKPKRGAAKAASANIKKTSNMKLNTKMRRPSNETSVDFNNHLVKIEKKSDSMLLETALTDVTNDNMPPPTAKPKRGRKKVKKEEDNSERVTRSTRSNRSTRNKEPEIQKLSSVSMDTRKDSDVLIQEVPVVVVEITDSESETEKSKLQDEVKTKKGRPQKKTLNKMKMIIKKEKLVQDEEKNVVQNSSQEVSLYEDALSENKSPAKTLNETHIIIKNTLCPSNVSKNKTELTPEVNNLIKTAGVHLNCTVALEKMRSTFTLNSSPEQPLKLNETKILPPKPSTPDNLLTDDDDSIEVPPAKTPNKKQPAKTKPIFSPYGSSPVKKRVAAFEKLGTADIPARVTRTKTRNLANAEKEETSLNNRAIPSTKTKKFFTPSANNKLPTMIPQSEKLKKNTSAVSSDSVKSLTAVKASRAELQERRQEEQRRKQEHENEVKRKKEAILQAKIEEQKRKREEKQLKAQNARELQEREKEEKILRSIQEKNERLQKEEQAKRDWENRMAKQALKEEKLQQMHKQEKLEQKKKLNKKPPPLPTDDIQDSDDEDENPKHKYVGPLWSQRQNLYPTLYYQRYVPTSFTTELFQMQAQTPDLLEIFETVNADVLRRNSSAVWRTPPRYSTLPKF